MTIYPLNKSSYIQLNFAMNHLNRGLRGDLFDSLPLAIAEQVMHQIGGRIWETEKTPNTTTICLSLPIPSEL